MQTEQIPLSLIGVKGFNYTKSDFTEVVYDPSKQVSNSFMLTQRGKDTVSDLSTTSGLWSYHDDEERGVDD